MAAVMLEGPVGKTKIYRVRWRFAGQRPRKSLGAVTKTEASRRRDEIAETLRLVEMKPGDKGQVGQVQYWQGCES